MINDDLLHKWVNGELSEAELVTFQARPEYESMKAIYENTEHLKGLTFDSELMLQNIIKGEILDSTSIQDPIEIKRVKTFSLFVKMAAAAICLIILGTFLFFPQNAIVNNSLAEKSYDLPNGSQITLYPGSEYLINQSTWDSERNIELKGKAYFEVTKGKQFIVHTDKGRVEVLGTSFLVDSQENFQVSCDEGKVQVHSNHPDAKAKLLPGESFMVLEGEGQILKKIHSTKMTNLPLNKVLEEIESIFKIKIKVEGVDLNQKLTSGFQHDNIENAIKTVTMPLDIQYSIREAEITLTK